MASGTGGGWWCGGCFKMPGRRAAGGGGRRQMLQHARNARAVAGIIHNLGGYSQTGGAEEAAIVGVASSGGGRQACCAAPRGDCGWALCGCSRGGGGGGACGPSGLRRPLAKCALRALAEGGLLLKRRGRRGGYCSRGGDCGWMGFMRRGRSPSVERG